MNGKHGIGPRLVALVLGVFLLISGVAGVSTAGELWSRIGSFVAIGAGLFFLSVAARRRGNPS